MSLRCQRCGLAEHGPDNFLLTCRGCRKTWHHRHLMPPMEDQDLIRLITATTSGDTGNDLSSWTCRKCKKRATDATSSREQTASSESSLISSHHPSTIERGSGVTLDARLVDERERNNNNNDAAPGRRALVAKRAKSSAANQPGPTLPGGADQPVRMTGTALQESPPTHSHPFMAARKFTDTVSTTSAEDDVEMMVDSPAPSEYTLRAASQVSYPPSSSRSESVADADVRGASSSSEQNWEARPGGIKPAADGVDDDPEDLYGPPVERRIIRILPSLAEELRDQQRRVAVEKEKRRAPLAPDWILARHANDPLWKGTLAEGRKRRKPTARRLGDNGLDVSELLGCYTVQNWVREHKT